MDDYTAAQMATINHIREAFAKMEEATNCLIKAIIAIESMGGLKRETEEA